MAKGYYSTSVWCIYAKKGGVDIGYYVWVGKQPHRTKVYKHLYMQLENGEVDHVGYERLRSANENDKGGYNE